MNNTDHGLAMLKFMLLCEEKGNKTQLYITQYQIQWDKVKHKTRGTGSATL